jgi:hypothetical protein
LMTLPLFLLFIAALCGALNEESSEREAMSRESRIAIKKLLKQTPARHVIKRKLKEVLSRLGTTELYEGGRAFR